MFGLGLWEILAIVVIVLVVINPKDWPKIVRRIGAVYGKLTQLHTSMMRMIREVEAEARRGSLPDIEENRNEIKPGGKEG
jgi:Sec-independent protein translocase protein TatA